MAKTMEFPRYNAETLAAIAEVQEMKKNPSQYNGFTSVESLFEELDADGDKANAD